jgi:hypothetical protein
MQNMGRVKYATFLIIHEAIVRRKEIFIESAIELGCSPYLLTRIVKRVRRRKVAPK